MDEAMVAIVEVAMVAMMAMFTIIPKHLAMFTIKYHF